MKTLFNYDDRSVLRTRLLTLGPDSARLWGKMNVAQMVTHCARALAVGAGDVTMKQSLFGKLLSPFVRSSILGAKPFSRNSPTDPTLVVADSRALDIERGNLLALMERFAERGDAAANSIHSFFGRLSAAEWGHLMYKHIDHHLQQFGA